jgi:hypothetical protein
MGIEIIRLGDKRDTIPAAGVQDLATVHFSTHSVAQPPMSIWLMAVAKRLPILPWCVYNAGIDEDIHKLYDLWNITSAQSLFDFLYLSLIKKTFPSDLYVLFPGNIKTDAWDKIKDPQRVTFQRGQGCLYRLEASYGKKLDVNWVPFYQPQSVVKDPSFDHLWRLFVAAKMEDVANSISFFSLSDSRKFPDAVTILIQQNENRSESLSGAVDWFGVFSSPLTDRNSACAVAYMKNKALLSTFVDLETRFKYLLDQCKAALLADTSPASVLRLLGRLAAV